jgi:hypothetical protein
VKAIQERRIGPGETDLSPDVELENDQAFRRVCSTCFDLDA